MKDPLAIWELQLLQKDMDLEHGVRPWGEQ